MCEMRPRPVKWTPPAAGQVAGIGEGLGSRGGGEGLLVKGGRAGEGVGGTTHSEERLGDTPLGTANSLETI